MQNLPPHTELRPRRFFLWTANISSAIHAALFVWIACGLFSNPCNLLGCLLLIFIAVRQFQAVYHRNGLAAYNLTCIYFLFFGAGIFYSIFFLSELMRGVSRSMPFNFTTLGIFAIVLYFLTIFGYGILGWMNYQWAKFLSQIPWNPFPSQEEPPTEEQKPEILYGPPLQFSIGFLLGMMTLLAMILSFAKIIS